MGCRLPKLRRAEERQSPGKIYSTLRRPQVETKVGVAYTYHFLDFLLGKEEVPVSSVLCLSSVRELPVQVRELYAQGFVLVAVHPFVHPCGPRHARIQRQLHRAVLLKETPPSLEKNQLKWAGHRLETDVCVAGHQALDPEVIQNYVKRIQDVSEQGVMFVGFLQQPGGGPCFLGSWDPDELSSLHSSPSPIHRQPFSSGVSPTDPADPRCGVLEPESTSFSPSKPAQNFELAGEEPSRQTPEESTDSTDIPQDRCTSETNAGGQNHVPAGALGALLGPLSAETLEKVQQLDRSPPRATKTEQERPDSDADLQNHRERLSSSPESSVGSPVLDLGGRTAESNVGFTESQSPQRVRSHNNNIHLRDKTSENEKESAMSPLTQGGTQLFALYNHTGELNISERFYSLRVPLRVQKEAGLTTEVDAHWLDHMTQHFTSGAHLIDGFFHLGDDNDNGISSVDSVFIFQSSAEEMAAVSYDAIVVEQWTVVDGVVVRTDYVPLLQSLAPYGWRLMCVLPTPIVKTNSDGSLSTKQILFLQRPTLQRKRKDFKMLNLRGRSKARKSYCGETPEKEGENASPVMESEVDELLRNTNEEEEEEEDEEKGDGKSEGASPGRGEEEAGRGEGEAAPSPQTRGRVSDGDWEEDKETPSDRREKSARWTGGDGAVKEERIKQQQLSERALFSGVC